MTKGAVIALPLIVALVSACSGGDPSIADQLGDSIFGEAPPVPEIDTDAAIEGRVVYQANCSQCHGADLEGADDWMTADEQGRLPPPPMDSSGHTWHHSDQLLADIIANGSPDPSSAMVGFGDRLSAAEIAAILAFFKTRWGPDERRFQWTVTWQELERAAP